MDAGGGGGLGDVHFVIDDVHQNLQHHGDDAAAPRRARGQKGLAILENNGRRHGTERPLAALNGVRLATDQAIGVRGAGLGGEIIHFVVQQNARTRRHDARAETEIQSIGIADHVALAVHHGKMRGFVTLVRRWVAMIDLFRRPGAKGIDPAGQMIGVGF